MTIESETPHYVSNSDLENLLSSLGSVPGDPRAGFFGPESVSWRVNRESAIFLGAGRAALLQLAHPWVAASLLHHSSLINDAIGRFHSTFRVVYTMLFGTRAQALAASRQLYRRHTAITGELPHTIGVHRSGERYEANEITALRWVYATLVESAVLAYEFVLSPLTSAGREQYYSESKRMAILFGLNPGSLPADWSAFTSYCAEMLESPLLGIDDNARALGRSVMSGVGTWLRPPRWYRSLTAWWMPPRFRQEFDLATPEEKFILRGRRHLRFLYLRIPRAIRYVGPFHEAEARLRGRVPGAFTRQSNRFWMGQPQLLFPQLSR
ncbi:MAG: DUF2236 domain-containing protein [Acidobacteriaceae bacterium]|nr:DUF2236 domain-containing protein [Acidobacteriaceae bacterium]